MNKQTKELIKHLRYTQGQLDCALNIATQKSSKYYLKGYAFEYARQQALTWQTEQQQVLF